MAHGDMSSYYPIFLHKLQSFFIGQDARELDLILERVLVYRLNFRLGGIALGIPLATIEFAILDMMGKIAGLPMGQLVGDLHNEKVGVYVATEFRERPLEKEPMPTGRPRRMLVRCLRWMLAPSTLIGAASCLSACTM